MIELVKSPSTRVLIQGRLALWLIVSLVFVALLFAAGAQAAPGEVPPTAEEASPAASAVAGEVPSTAEEARSVDEEAPSGVGESPPAAPPVAGEVPSTAEEARSVDEEAPSGVGESAPAAPPVAGEVPSTAEEARSVAEEAPSGVGESPPAAPPVAGEVPSTAEEARSVAEEAPSVAGESPPAAPPVAGEAPPPAPPTAKEVPPVAEEAPTAVEKKTVEQTAGEVAAEMGSEVIHGMGEDPQVPADASGMTHKDAAGEVAPGVSIVVTTAIAPDAPPEISTVQDQLSLTSRPRTTSARCAGRVSCELAAIGASIRASYTCGRLGISAVSLVSTILATIDASPSPTAITAGAHSDSQDGGSAVENHPPAPLPGSGGSGGGSGGSAAAGGAGSASSASSTLVGVLLQAAPRAMRRLRLAQPSWRTSFFVLIPERPD
jgi:hypothetical protein